MISPKTTGETEGGGNHRDSLCLQKGYLDVRFMFATKLTTASATFNLVWSIKQFIIASRQFNENFCILPLYGEGHPISKPQDVPNSKDAITVYYRHRLVGNNVSGKSEDPVDEHDRADETRDVVVQEVFVKRSGEEAVLLGWIPGSHPSFSFRDSMREAIKDQMPIKYDNVEWALLPKTIYYTRASDSVKLSTSGVSLQVTKQAPGQVDSTREDIAKKWQKVSPHRGSPLVGKHFVPFGKSGDMGYSITTQIIHRQNAMFKSNKQRVLTDLNNIDAVIEMETPETQNVGHIDIFTLREAFLSYKDNAGEPISALLRLHKLVAHIVSSSMTTTMKPLTKF
jgi:hypothetical protein